MPDGLALVTMGRAFHWMDRAATLEALEAKLSPKGAVAIIADSVVEGPVNAWYRPRMQWPGRIRLSMNVGAFDIQTLAAP